MDMSVGVLDHYNVSTRKLKETVAVLRGRAGNEERSAPAVQFPRRLALQRGPSRAAPQRHSGTDKPQQPDSGVIDHVAFGCRGFEAMKQHLTGKGVPYRVNQVPNSTRWQIFLRDPNNVEIELNFETKNEIAA